MNQTNAFDRFIILLVAGDPLCDLFTILEPDNISLGNPLSMNSASQHKLLSLLELFFRVQSLEWHLC